MYHSANLAPVRPVSDGGVAGRERHSSEESPELLTNRLLSSDISIGIVDMIQFNCKTSRPSCSLPAFHHSKHHREQTSTWLATEKIEHRSLTDSCQR